jgi:conjugal transfer pilus assembly protein TraV
VTVSVVRSAWGGLLIAVLLEGCTSLSGVGGEAQYACPAPRGIQCGSVSANYRQSLHRGFPDHAQATGIDPVAQLDNPPLPPTLAPTSDATVGSATRLRSPPRILKLWVAPWEDRDGVLHDAAFVFVPIDHGRWLLDHVPSRTSPLTRDVKPPPRDLLRPPDSGSAPTATESTPSASPAESKDGDAR